MTSLNGPDTDEFRAHTNGPLSQFERAGRGSAKDFYHRATSCVVDDPAARRFTITDGDGVTRKLYQLPAEMNGKQEIFEWIVDSSGPSPCLSSGTGSI
jgi:hypothetical protein